MLRRRDRDVLNIEEAAEQILAPEFEWGEGKSFMCFLFALILFLLFILGDVLFRYKYG
jgi:hypothetical protein